MQQNRTRAGAGTRIALLKQQYDRKIKQQTRIFVLTRIVLFALFFGLQLLLRQVLPQKSLVSKMPQVTTYKPLLATAPKKRDWQKIGANVRKNIDNKTWHALFQSRGIFDEVYMNPSELVRIRQSLTQMYGNITKPVILGLETCETYRSLIPISKRNLVTAGLFWTGTSLMDQYVQEYVHGVSWKKSIPWENPVAYNVERTGSDTTVLETTPTKRPHMEVKMSLILGVSFVLGICSVQILWADAKWLKRVLFAAWICVIVVAFLAWPARVEPHRILNRTSFPIVLIRDPFHWMQQMCEKPSAASWNHTSLHCPSLVSMESVSVVFEQGDRMEWESLVHMYNEWYRAYVLEADFPHLVIRYEDLLIHTKSVISAVADCVGANVSSEFRYKSNPEESIIGTELILRSLVDPKARLKNLTILDLQYAEENLNADLLQLMHFTIPT